MKHLFDALKAILILAVLGLIGFWLWQHDAVDNTKNIEFINAHFYNGELIDLQNEIGVQSSDDVRWYMDKYDTIVIEYGKILLKYKTSDFVTSEVQNELNSILITTEQNKETLEFKLYWNGEELPKYVKK